MKEKTNQRRIRDIEVVAYISVYFIYLLIQRIIPLTLIFGQTMNAFVASALAIIGVLLIVQDLLTDRILFKSKYFVLPIAFLVALAISDFVNIKYGWIDNAKTAVWFCIHFFLLYTIVTRLGEEKTKKLIDAIVNTLTAICLVFSIISLIQYIFLIGYKVKTLNGFLKMQGFLENRLFGTYSDPNAAAMLAIVIIIFNAYYFSKNKNIWKRIFYGFSIAIQSIYIILSGSRTAVICLLASIIVAVFLVARNKCIEKNFKSSKIALTLISSVVVCCVTFFAIYIPSVKLLSYIPIVGSKANVSIENCPSFLVMGISDKNKENSNNIEDTPKNDLLDSETGKNDGEALNGNGTKPNINKGDVLKREDVKDDNILNNRTYIWRNYLRTLKGIRLITGLSPRNAVQYITSNFPDNYISRTQYIPHSDYVAVIAYMGILGSVIVLVSIILAAVYIVKKLLSKNQLSNMFITCIAVAVAIGLYGLSYMDVLFCNTVTGCLFWLFMSFIMNSKDDNKNN